MLEWSDDDEDQSVLPPSMKEASADTESLKQARESYVRATVEVPVMQTTEVPEQRTEGGALEHQEERQPAAEAQESSHKADQAAVPGGLGRHRRFKKINRKTKPAMLRPMTSEEKMTTAPIQESLSARRIEDGPAATPSRPGDGESLAHTTGASATATMATTEKVVTLETKTAAVVDAPEVTDATLSTAEEQTSSPAGMPGVVGAAVRPQSPLVVPQATAEEVEVVEIECAAPKPQSVRILQKCGEEVVVVEEENTTREIKRLKSTITGVMTQIKGIARTADQ